MAWQSEMVLRVVFPAFFSELEMQTPLSIEVHVTE
jgi:hypothetical protein